MAGLPPPDDGPTEQSRSLVADVLELLRRHAEQQRSLSLVVHHREGTESAALDACAAVVVGRLAERGRLFRSLLAAALGMLAIHLGGWAQLAVLTGSPDRALALGTLPFLAQDLLKVALAGLVLWRGHHALRLRA